MYQSDIDRAVALVTGEAVTEISRRGFCLANLVELTFDPEPDDLPPQTVDWDELERRRFIACF